MRLLNSLPMLSKAAEPQPKPARKNVYPVRKASRVRRGVLLLLGFTAFLPLLSPAVSRAGALTETHGMGARAMGMGGAFTGVADDVSAVYYNPAGLAQIQGHQAHFEYLFVKPEVKVGVAAEPGRVFIDKWTKAPMAGIVIDLTRAIKLSRRIVVGWAGYFPDNLKSVYKVRHGSFYDPFFPRYGDSSSDQAIMLLTDGAVEVFPWLLVGGGINLQIHGQSVNMEVGVDALGRPVMEASRADMDVTTEIHPLAGLMIKPVERLRIGLTWRQSVAFIVAGGMRMQMKLVLGPGLSIPVPIPLTVEARGHYRPQQFAFGASYRVTDSLLLASDLTYYDWRPYHDEAARPLDPPMKNVVVPRLGAEYRLLAPLVLRAGYSFQESPLRPQNSGANLNLLDNDLHELSLGAGVFWDVFGFFPKPAQWSIFYQLQILAPRTFPNVDPGGPDLRSSGAFHGFGFGIQLFL